MKKKNDYVICEQRRSCKREMNNFALNCIQRMNKAPPCSWLRLRKTDD